MTACVDRRGDLAAHLLGCLEPAEEREFRAHLAGCAGCTAELAEMSGLPDLLDLVPVDRVGAAPAEPDVGFADRLVAVAARRQRVRRRRWLSAAAAIVIIVGGAGAAAGELASGQTVQRFHAADARSGVSAQVSLQPSASGTSIALRISGVPDRADCTLVAIARDGRRDVAGSWQASYTGTASMQGSTAIAEAQLARLVVQTSAGQQLIAIRVAQ